MSSLLKEARDLKATLESEIIKLWTIAEEEKKKTEEARFETIVATEWCDRMMKRLEDLRGATVVKEDSLNKVINDLEARVKTQSKSELTLNTAISELCKGEGVDWEMAIEVEGFTPVRGTLFNLALKSAKELVQAEQPWLDLDFLAIEDDEEVEDTQSGTMNLDAEGQKIALSNDEAVDQTPEMDNEGAPEKERK